MISNEDNLDSFRGLMLRLEKIGMLHILDMVNQHKETCLHIAAVNNKPEYIKALLKLGEFAFSSFFLSWHHYLAKLYFICFVGVSPNAVDNIGNTPLHLAVEEAYIDCISELVSSDNYSDDEQIDLNIVNDHGMTAIHLAVRNHQLPYKQCERILKILLTAGASPKIPCKNGNSILHMTVQLNLIELVKFILTNTSVDIQLANIAGQTALDLAKADPDAHAIVKIIECKLSGNEIANICGSSVAIGLADIKSEPMDYFDTNADARNEVVGTELDEACLNDLCIIFNKDNEWIKLADALYYNAFVDVWKVSKNPSMMLFKFAEVCFYFSFEIIHFFELNLFL